MNHDSTTNEGSKPRRSRRRWWLAFGALVLVVPIALLGALPWIVSSPWAKRRIEAFANRLLAPGGVAFDRVSVSWFKPTEITGPALINARGVRIVSAPTGTFSWSLWQIVFTRPIVGTLWMHQGDVDLERSADGKVDLLETLAPILAGAPKRTIRVRIDDATLRFRQEGLADPFYANKAEIALDLPRHPEPIAWDLRLSRTDAPTGPGTMTIGGHLDPTEVDGPPRNASLSITADNWPWRITVPEVHAEGLFAGSLAARLTDGALNTQGDAILLNLLVNGAGLSGDTLRQDKVEIAWRVEGRDGSYQADHLRINAPVANLSARGTFPPTADRDARVEGHVDLAALSEQLRNTLRLQDDIQLEKGAIAILAEAKPRAQGDGQRIDVTAKVADLIAKKGDRTITWSDPATLSAALDRSADNVKLDRLDVRTPFLTATGRGDVDSGIFVDAEFDLAAVHQRLREWVDFGDFQSAGRGTLSARYQRAKAEYQFTTNARVDGLVLEGMPVVETLRRDEVRLEFNANGSAEPSGLPRGWRRFTLLGQGDHDKLKVESSSDPANPDGATLGAIGQTELEINGARRILGADLGGVQIGAEAIDLGKIALSVQTVVAPEEPPAEPISWTGTGRYDRGKDELTVRGAGPEASAPPAIALERLDAGGFRSPGSAWFKAGLVGDVAALQKLAGVNDPSITGQLVAGLQGRENEETWDLAARIETRDLARPVGKDAVERIGEIDFSARAALALGEKRLDIAELALVAPNLRVGGAGAVTELGPEPVIDLNGMLTPDWEGLTKTLAARVEPNASIRGRSRPWRLAGKIPLKRPGDEPIPLNGELGVRLDLVDIFGMRMEGTEIVARVVDGALLIDPIDATLNTGKLHLDPVIATDDQGERWLRLSHESSLTDAVINDEVSHRVLSFAAPVLDQATRVQGMVSLDLNSAEIALGGDPSRTRIEGDILFDDVRFMPGPLADQLISFFNLERKPLLTLNEPVSVRLLGRKIHQEGLILPVGKVAVIGVRGWVDFDKNIDLLASFAAVPPQNDVPILSRILESTQLHVPITGTLDNPRLNGDQIADRFKDMGLNLLETTLGIGQTGLDRLLQGGPPRRAPRPQPDFGDGEGLGNGGGNGNAAEPAPSGPLLPGFRLPFSRTPEERQLQREQRKERRLEKKAERRARRGLPPD